MQQDQKAFDLPNIAVKVLRWGAVDETFFKITSKGNLLAGDLSVPDPPREDFGSPVFFNGQIQGRRVRVVSTRFGSIQVSVAETVDKRRIIRDEVLVE